MTIVVVLVHLTRSIMILACGRNWVIVKVAVWEGCGDRLHDMCLYDTFCMLHFVQDFVHGNLCMRLSTCWEKTVG